MAGEVKSADNILALYCDHNATSPMQPTTRAVVFEAMERYWANSFSQHSFGRAAAVAVDKSRHQIADWLNVDVKRIRFTSGATESNSWVFQSLISESKPYALVSSIEHPSVLEWGTHFIPTDENGVIDVDVLEQRVYSMRDQLAVVSVMAANNETGVLQPLDEVYAICSKYHVPVHCDATQLLGRLHHHIPADFITLSAHKAGGPKGVGVLAVSTEIAPFLRGGPQERATRAGTHNVPAIVGMGYVVSQAKEMSCTMRDQLEMVLQRYNGCILAKGVARLPNTTSVIFSNPGDLIVMALDLHGLQASTGSACSSGASKQSHVLTAMGKTGIPVRFSLGQGNDFRLISQALETVLGNLEGE